MTQEEYKERKISIEKECEIKKKELDIEYAMSNNPYKLGDIVEDHIGKLRIEKIKIMQSYYGFPVCVYSGIELKKDGTPLKRQTNRNVSQLNILK